MADKAKFSEPNAPDQGGVPQDVNEANKLIGSQNTKESGVNLTDSQVDEVKSEAAETTKKNAEKADSNMVESIDSDNKGYNGKKVSNVFRSISGPSPMKASAVNTLVRGIPHNVGTEDEVRIADVDKLDRNLALAESMYDSVQSEVIEEGVRGTSNSDDAIIGDPSDVNVYSEQTTIVSETVTRRTKKYDQMDARHRSSGTEFHRGNYLTSVSGDYIDLELDGTIATGTVRQNGHAFAKGKDQKENLLFNMLAPDGGYLPNKFIMVKTGFFLVKGINPTPTSQVIQRIGFVKRKAGNSYVLAEVYQARGNGIFDVEDVTPLVTDCLQASHNAVELITCNKSKFSMGVAEQMTNAFIQLANLVDNRDLIKYPETNLYRNRCSLWSIKGISTVDSGLDCYNNLEQYVEFMNALSESEFMYLIPRMNILNLKANLKMAKGFEGMQSKYLKDTDHSYWRNIAKAYPNNDSISTPTVAAYLSSMASPHRYNRPAALLYGMREFWAKLEAQASLLDEGDLKTAILDQCYIAQEVADQLKAKLSQGMIVDPSSVTSDARVELADVGQFILHYDPNDLLQYNAHFDGSGATLSYSANVYPVAGYVNAYTGSGGYTAETAVYNVCPTWLETIAKIISSNRAIVRLLDYRPTTMSGGVKLNMLQYQYSHSSDVCRFHPWIVDTYMPSWINFWFLDGLMEVQHDVLSNKNQRSGYFRYLAMVSEIGDKSSYTNEKVTVGSLLSELVNSEYVKMDEFARVASDFKQLPEDVVKRKMPTIDDTQIAIANNVDMRAYQAHYVENDTIVILNPSRFDRHVNDLEGWTLIRPENPGSYGTVEISCSNIRELIESIPTSAASAATAARFWPNMTSSVSGTTYSGSYLSSVDGFTKYQILMWTNSNNKVCPVVLKRKYKYNGAKTVLVGTDNANPSVLGFEDNPQDALYGHDGHQNLIPCDGYVLLKKVNTSYKADTGYGYNDAPATAEYMICPFIEWGQTGYNDAQTRKAAYHNPIKAFRSQFANAKNKIYATTATIDPQSGDVTGDEVRGMYRDTVPAGQNTSGFKSFICQPSLYGFERLPIFYSEFMLRDRQYNSGLRVPHTYELLPLAHGKLKSFFGMFAHQTFIYLPQDYEWPDSNDGSLTYQSLNGKNYHMYLNARFAVDVPAASDWKWYNWQDYRSAGYVDEDAQPGFTSTLENIAELAQKPLLREMIYPVPLLTDDNINKEDATLVDTIGVNVRYSVLEDNKSAAIVRYASDRYLKFFRELDRQPETDRWFIAAENYTSGAQTRPQYLFIKEVDETKNPDLNSVLFYNDYRTYRVDRPIIRLNQDWNAIGMTRSLVKEQFVK